MERFINSSVETYNNFLVNQTTEGSQEILLKSLNGFIYRESANDYFDNSLHWNLTYIFRFFY
jgi:hypothetical protein